MKKNMKKNINIKINTKILFLSIFYILFYKLIFMNLTDFEQMELDVEFIGDKIDLLRENDEVILEMYDEKPIGIQLPNTLIFEVSETEAVVKGQTAASSNKPAVLENGLRVMVPPFIEQGEKVIINTEDLTYLKRAE